MESRATVVGLQGGAKTGNLMLYSATKRVHAAKLLSSCSTVSLFDETNQLFSLLPASCFSMSAMAVYEILNIAGKHFYFIQV